MPQVVYYVIYLLFGLGLLFISNMHYVHIFQLEGYKIINFLVNVSKQGDYFKIHIYREKNSKKPLKYTKRVIRLLIINLLVNIAFIALSYNAVINIQGDVIRYILILFITFLHVFILPPIYTAIAGIILYPVETAVHEYYKGKARKKLEQFPHLKKVAITGSFGKTSCKFILTKILSEKYNTLTTPSSYNTPMGISKVITESLTPEHEVFVCEMGARKPKQIRELVNIVKPQIGMITSIGNQHLDTFKTIDRVANTKYELIEGLPDDGVGVFNIDNDYVFKLYKKTEKTKLVYGLKQELGNETLTVKDIKTTNKGSNFKLFDKDGNMVFCTTTLLGEHNILNILGCAVIAYHMGLTLQEISSGISKIERIEHRLEIVPTDNGVTIIDDAYNANPQGAERALKVIKDFENVGQRIVVTPGMIELGKDQYDENYKFGKLMSGVVDIAIIVGKTNREPIVNGLRDGNMPDDKVICVDSLNEASTKLGVILKAGDVVLFENDLPDNYS